MGRNPKSGDAVALRGKYVPHFKPGKELRERVNVLAGDGKVRTSDDADDGDFNDATGEHGGEHGKRGSGRVRVVTDLLWLLLPVAAGAGWFAGRRSGERKPEAYWDYATHFHRGLSDLFNDRDAIDEDVFDTLGSHVQDGADDMNRPSSDVAARDTADTHLALGKLFRRRGDVERAILIHEALIERPGLDCYRNFWQYSDSDR